MRRRWLHGRSRLRLLRRAGLLAAIVAVATGQPAAATWFEARTDHFTVYSEGTEAAVRTFTARLERFDAGLRRLHSLPSRPEDRANPLTVYVVANAEAVRRLCNGNDQPSAATRKWCTNVAGFYLGRAEGSLAFTPRRSGSNNPFDLNAETVLFHEYSHHFMMQNYNAAYPAWFVEGFAEFNSTASFEKDGSLGFGRIATHRAYGLLTMTPLSLPVMLTGDDRPLSASQRESLYGRGWLLTHYLTFDETRKGQLSTYLRAINDGKPSLDAAKLAFGDLSILNRNLDTYLRTTKLFYYSLPATTVPEASVVLRPLTPGEGATMPVRLRSSRGVDKATAATIVVEARRLATPFPADPGAQDVLAEAEFDAGNDDAAEAAADRALAARPADLRAMLYKGRAIQRRAAIAKVTDPAKWKTARSWFAKANRVDTDNAAPLLMFYNAFLAQGIAPTKNAVVGLERAFVLAPQDDDLRFLLARQYLLDDDPKSARSILAPLAFSPHAAADNPIKRLVAMIDAGDTAGWKAEITKPDVPAVDPE